MDQEQVIRTETQAPLLVGIAVGFVVSSGALVLSRLYTRVHLLGIAGADDWTIAAALALSIVVSVSTCMEARYGMGRHSEAVSIEDTLEQLKYLYISILHYNIGMNMVKISFLLQFRRIFQKAIIQSVCFWSIIGVVIWAAVQVTLLGISCLPISFIVPSTADWCLDTLPVWYFSSAMSLATDILIFCIPLPSVLKLQLPMRQKAMVLFIFCLGFFVCIISVYRICTLRDAVMSQDPAWDNVGAAIWSCIELNCAIICACLPTLRPLLAKVIPGLSTAPSGRESYERYGSSSQYAMGSNARVRSRGAYKESSPRSISTEELALNDLDSALQSTLPSVRVHSNGRQTRHNDPKRILVTTETSIQREDAGHRMV
ncbi:hypothetical protein B0I35DRAFT_354648 [Stachybotrys elegans]|uniref:Rhodopsin domain-containing protein n=1 Tax=Stachybotrys elegans TaxID=80388 RepID=A0A8K0SP38_9HYPO|nr:hypothetical protein B0I35DRAFT_354648 [Stachybotrys elegans]